MKRRLRRLRNSSITLGPLVSTTAYSTTEQQRWNKEDCVPLTKDVLILENYLRKIEDEGKAELRQHVSTTYKILNESLLAQILVFNKKSEGECRHWPCEQGHIQNTISGGKTAEPQADLDCDL